MSKLIKVKVNLLEFTYRDKEGYHTIVGYGEVPLDNQEVKTALAKGYLIQVEKETIRSTRSSRSKNTSYKSSPKNKEE